MKTESIMLVLNTVLVITNILIVTSFAKKENKHAEVITNKQNCTDDNLNERWLGIRAEIKALKDDISKTEVNIIAAVKRELGGKTIKPKKKRKKKSGR